MTLSEFVKRYKKAWDDSRRITDARMKERRQFPVAAFPHFVWLIFQACATLSLVTVWSATLGPEPTSEQPLFAYTVLDWSMGNVMQTLIAPFLTTMVGALVEPLSLRLSTRSRSTSLGPGHQTVRDVWTQTLRSLSCPPGGVLTLPSLFQRLGRLDLYTAAVVPWNQLAFFVDLVSVVASTFPGPVAPSDVFTAFANQHGDKSGHLRLKTKVYMSRSDERAYIVDGCAFRSLITSALQALMLPSSMSDRRRLPSERVNPAVGRNIIKRTFVVPKGKSAIITVSDTSSFTSSGVNSWIALFALLVSLPLGECEKLHAPIMLRVAGHLISCTLPMILQLYLYTTVGASCYDEDAGEHYVSQGGYLGVGGNITSALLTQSVILLFAQSIITRQHSIQCDIQSGGDDVFSLMLGDDANLVMGREVLESTLTTYVGRQKEFNWFWFNDSTADCVQEDTGLMFCKKPILMTTERDPATGALNVTLDSQLAYPLLEALCLPAPKSANAKRKEIQAFYASAVESTKLLPDADYASRLLIGSYVRIKNHPLSTIPILCTERTFLYEDDDVIKEGGFQFSRTAYDIVMLQPVIQWDNRCWNFTLSGKVSQALSAEAIAVMEGRNGTTLYVTRRERRRFVCKTDYPYVLLPCNETDEELRRLDLAILGKD